MSRNWSGVATPAYSTRLLVLIFQAGIITVSFLAWVVSDNKGSVVSFLVTRAIMAALTGVLFVRLRRRYTRVDHWLWLGAFVINLTLVTAMVIDKGGLNTDVYILYILLVVEAGVILGMRAALFTLLLACLLYSVSIQLVFPEQPVNRIVLRCLIMTAIGTIAAYLSHL